MRHHDDARMGSKMRHHRQAGPTVPVTINGTTYRVPAGKEGKFRGKMKDAERGYQRGCKGHADAKPARRSDTTNQWTNSSANAYRWEDKR